MITALWRKIRSDLKTQWLQFGLITGVLALSSMLLTISLLVMDSADQPWDRTFKESNGPHVWMVSLNSDQDFSVIENDPAVSETTGVIQALTDNPLFVGDEQRPLFLYAMDTPPPVAHPLLAEGDWLDPQVLDEVVLDYSMARYYSIEVGDIVTVLAADGKRALKVVGLAVTAHWFPYNETTVDVSPGVAYIARTTLEAIQPDQEHWFGVLGVRLYDPQESKNFVEQINRDFPGQMRSLIEWQWVRQNATYANQLNVLFMGFLSMLGLVAVGLIIFNTIGGQIMSQYREIGLLKATGFKPGQVTLMFLGENLFSGFLASVLGILAGLLVAPALISPLAENLNTPPPDLLAPAPMITVLLVVELAVTLAVLIPAWQAGRIDTVQAISTGFRRGSRKASWLARLAIWLRMPAVIVLGVKDIFARPLRAVISISSLVLTLMVAIVVVGGQATAKALTENRYYLNGTTADIRIQRNFIPHNMIADEISASPDVPSSYQELVTYGQSPEHADQPIAVRLLSGDFTDFYFQINEGRILAAPGEAVVGYAVLKLLDAKIGDRIVLTVDGKPLQLTIVGRSMEWFNLGHVILTSLETYQQQVDPNAEPTTYYLRLNPGVDAELTRQDWLEQSQGLAQISVITDEPQAAMMQLVDVISLLGLIMIFVAGANLMSAGLLSIRERVRDFGIQKTVGLTPAQIGLSVVVGTVTLALFSLVIGSTLGVWIMVEFIRQVGMQIGAGPDFYTLSWNNLSVIIPLAVTLAVISSLLPASRAAKMEVTQALRYE